MTALRETETASRSRKLGSSRKVKVSGVVAVVAVRTKLNDWKPLAPGLVTLNRVVPPKAAERVVDKSEGAPASGAHAKEIR